MLTDLSIREFAERVASLPVLSTNGSLMALSGLMEMSADAAS
jgi:hypothetical protein